MSKKQKKLTVNYLKKKKFPPVLITGLIIASVLGWTGWQNLDNIKNYYQIKQVFPNKTKMVSITDGDTFTIKNGLSVRILGIDSPNRSQPGYKEAINYLTYLIDDKPLTLEYDVYQDDKYGRILAYVWIKCLRDIKIYCHDDRALVNEVMIKQGFAKKMTYSKRKKLKYDTLLQP